MSLVVAMVEGERLYVCADLRMVSPQNRPEGSEAHSPHYFNGVMKIIPISKSMAIAYAGTVSIALNIIREVHGLGLSLSSEIAQKIQETLARNGDVSQCDFLVLDAQNMEIHRIKDGSIEAIRSGRTWIGDIDAYSPFQEKLAENGYYTTPDSTAKSSAMMRSLDAVIEDSLVESVGEIPIALFNNGGEIQLVVSFRAHDNRNGYDDGVTDDWMIVNVTAPVERGVAALGFYLNKFKRGALYLPLIQDEPILIDGDTFGEFRTKVMEKFGIELLGGGFE